MAQGMVALARGDARAALASFDRSRRTSRCFVCTDFHEGRAFEALNEPDSAVAAYRRFVDGHDTDNENREWYLAAALQRLGEMHESKGDRAAAVDHYGRFVALWAKADAEFQPLVADIRRRETELRRALEPR
jgi:predicted TPR repeat methyltransferase